MRRVQTHHKTVCAYTFITTTTAVAAVIAAAGAVHRVRFALSSILAYSTLNWLCVQLRLFRFV